MAEIYSKVSYVVIQLKESDDNGKRALKGIHVTADIVAAAVAHPVSELAGEAILTLL